ncbi:flavin-dependent dehydrogenase [Leptolyngbya sp. 'hensonii']|uniref:NAD(P)/FAD-dependent oxidoreductase n=1 Tax=Leptolyngbya sp. 'hensonii' TaxID=1922337 RepID=UPI00094F923F|nr:flavin-dependent dehydrogenase [Leptolyngbya sp. 'hensonii']OLP17830.1 flavin-dependent dehydrogenase [Leptolyngbya sp. 'hensonii']
MKEILYLEIPTPDLAGVRSWLKEEFQPHRGEKQLTPEGFRWQPANQQDHSGKDLPAELSIFVWSVQRTTYLKVFRWAEVPLTDERMFLQELVRSVRHQFPHHYPVPPEIDLSQETIFTALAPVYPETVKFFQRMPNGEYDLTRVYWWEKRWRAGVRNPQQPQQVIARVQTETGREEGEEAGSSPYDLIYIGGALGVIHAVVMARLGYRVLLVERLPFGRMNREWNISRSEFQSLLDLGVFTPTEFEEVIAREYVDGFHKFFDANNPPHLKAPILHTPTVLNVGLDAEKLLRVCGEKLKAAGGTIWDETEFIRAEIADDRAAVFLTHLPDQTPRQAQGRLLVDAMGTASPIAWQLNGGRAFDSVCPTVGAVIERGFEPGVWDANYGDVLNSHGDISRGRQLIWELFPAEQEELTFYLFHYHQVHPDNPGSLLEMYEDFFTILPEYRRCDLEKLVWKKPTFGYIPGHFSVSRQDRRVAFDRLIAIGDAASLQSPLIFTGFGSLVRNLPRLTDLLNIALQNDLLTAPYLNQIRAYQSNVSVTWLFSKGMMVPTGQHLPPERINAMLNTFFGILADESPQVADAFIKDRADWLSFNRMALKAAWRNPALLLWIWQLAGPQDLLRWLGSYWSFTIAALLSALLRVWFPALVQRLQPWLEPRLPGLWFWLRVQSHAYTYGTGRSSPSHSNLASSKSHWQSV